MIDLDQIGWRQDFVTSRYVAENADELADPASMAPDSLAGATTYCKDIGNPYAMELAKRAGLLERYLQASGVERADIVRRAARAFNIMLI